MTAVIVANGRAPTADTARRAAEQAEIVIAANGGLLHCQALGLEPDLVIGDLDSLPDVAAAELTEAGVQVQRYPSDKDETDLELALAQAAGLGHGQIIVLAAFGGRWDQTFANMLLPAGARFRHLDISLLDENNRAWIVTGSRPAAWRGRAGDTVSLIPLTAHARGVTSHGLAYSLQAETLRFGESRGVSNSMLGERARLRLEDGMLLCIHTYA